MTDGAHTAHGQADRNEPASPKFANDGGAPSIHAIGEDTSVPSPPANNGHHPIADPEINVASIPQNQPAEHPADNLPDIPAQPDDGAHPAHPQVDANQPDSFKFADGGTIQNDPPALTTPSSGSSGAYEPAAPTLATTFDVPATAMSAAPDKFMFAENAGHGPSADHKTDMTDIDHPVPADIQQVLDTAHAPNAVSPPDPGPAHALQDTANAQAPYHQDAFHFA
jgi:hypothetical protein